LALHALAKQSKPDGCTHEARVKSATAMITAIQTRCCKRMAMTQSSLSSVMRKEIALPYFLDPASLRQAMAEGPAGASGPDVEAKARLLSLAALVLGLPLLLLLMW
jgi:hypothetical protein